MTNKEKLLKETYDKFIQTSLMDLPLDGIEQFIDPDIMGYGTANDEKILSISDYRELIIRQREQGKDIEMTIDILPVLHRITGNGNSALLIDEVTIKMIINNETHQLFMRLSSVLEYRDEKWFTLHFHGSLPGEAEGETDTWHINEWQKKNEDLQRLVDEKTIDLIQKNHELEIETALEKVRTIAMGMTKPDDMLNVCKTISIQLQSLGVEEIRNVQTAIIYKSKGTYLNYEYYRLHDKLLITEVDYHTHPTEEEFANQMLKSKDAFFNTRFEGTELKKWMEHQKNASQFVDSYLYKAQAVNYYFYSLGPVALGISTYSPLPENNLQIFKRFRNVFGLAYRRFIDIEKAVTQAREAQIEAALERVRAVAMGMNKHDDLLQICESSFFELKKLGFENLRNVVIHIPYDEENYFRDYDFSDFTGGQIGKVDYGMHPIVDEYLEKIRSAEDAFFEVVIDEDMLDGWNDFRRESGQMYDQRLDTANALYYYLFSIGIGDIGISTFKPINDSQIKTLKKFRNVFRLTYKRYTDITQAAAQAREAQVEAALERIRSRALGMRNSEDIGNVSDSFFTEFNKLTVKLLGCTISVVDEAKDSMELWRARSGIAVKPFDSLSFSFSMRILKKNLRDWYPTFRKALKEKKKYLMDELTAEKHTGFINSIAEQGNYSKEEKDKLFDALPEKLVTYYIFFKRGYLALMSEQKLSDENLAIAHRFVDVFDFAYTRFLDIVNAEAQAREAQIEAALERVRSRSMAMHSSEELVDASDVMFDQLKKLKIETLRIGICTIDGKTGSAEIWSRSEIDGQVKNKILGVVPPGTHPVFDNMVKAWKEKKPYFSSDREGNEVKAYYEKLSSCLSYPEPENYNKRESIAAFFFAEGSLNVISLEPLEEEECQIMVRFANVFGQMYTRFLDLQKAEAQAREAQIEAALERVRARAMAIHESNELAEVIQIVFKELNNLEFDTLECSIVTYDTNPKDLVYWSTGEYGAAASKVKLQYIDHPLLVDLFEDLRNGVKYRSGEYAGDLLKTWWERIFTETDFQFAPKEFIASWKEINRINYAQAVMNHGFIEFVGLEPLTAEKTEILKRFTKVVDLTYTRYDDVVKAEAQARESEIQLALERVRARTMAMQKSNELAQTAANLFEQMEVLGIKPYRCNIAVVDNKNKKLKLWSTTNHGNVIPVSSDIPFNENPVFKEIHKGWKKQKLHHTIKLVGEDRVTWTKYISKYVPFEEYKPKNINKSKLIKEAAIFNNFYFRQGYFIIHTTEEISKEDYDIIQRFANVFEQAYTRFLDLENAEYQNKIIQAENERKTEELEEARQLQLSMLPKDLPQLPNLDIAVYMQTATEVGGDYYDFQIGENGTLTAVIGDATGHGMKAGTIVTITKSLFHSLASGKDILFSFEEISRVIKGMNFRQLSMCLMMLKIKEDRISLSSAAMPPALVYRSKDKKVEEIEFQGMPLGAMKNFPYQIKESKMEKGDVILMLSDGLPELMNDKEEMYGYDKTKSEFQSVAKKSPEEIVEHLKTSASQWTNGGMPDDDVTFVVIKVK